MTRRCLDRRAITGLLLSGVIAGATFPLTACGVGANADVPDDGGAPDSTDAATAPDVLDAADALAPSRCTVTAALVECAHSDTTIADSLGTRDVAYATPLGAPPAGGWPTVLYFQGSLVAGHGAFTGAPTDPFGLYQLALTVKALLDRGYAVVAPDALVDGSTYWETNIPPYATAWSGSPDDVFMHNLLAALRAGTLGPIDASHLYAMGISSGGFMTSRMAVSYPGVFRALADCSGSYATCSDICTVPTPLPSGHPPTIFLHGDLDTIVPMTAVQPYVDALTAEGFVVSVVTDATAGHQWLAAGSTAIPAWFDAHH